VPKFFHRVQNDADRHGQLISEMQRMRGQIYLKDGAIDPETLIQGRHQLSADGFSWHLLVANRDGELCGCSRYREHRDEIDFSKLSVARSTLADCPNWGHRIRSAVQSEITISRRLGYPYVEVGGWALTEHVRRTTEALRMALSLYALGQALGGGVGISTATARHGSASILKGVGGRPLEDRYSQMPSYYDSSYRCEMEILRFYSWAPTLRYASWVSEMKAHLRNILVLTAEPLAGIAAL